MIFLKPVKSLVWTSKDEFLMGNLHTGSFGMTLSLIVSFPRVAHVGSQVDDSVDVLCEMSRKQGAFQHGCMPCPGNRTNSEECCLY